MDYPDFQEKVLFWAKIRGFDEADPKSQFLKVIEESVMEISEAKMLLSEDKLVDAIGDTAVTLEILNAQLDDKSLFPNITGVFTGAVYELFYHIGSIASHMARGRNTHARRSIVLSLESLKVFAEKEGFHFESCCKIAWDEIKNRNGMMVDGVYIKEADFTEEQASEFYNRGIREDPQWTPEQIEAFKKEGEPPMVIPTISNPRSQGFAKGAIMPDLQKILPEPTNCSHPKNSKSIYYSDRYDCDVIHCGACHKEKKLKTGNESWE